MGILKEKETLIGVGLALILGAVASLGFFYSRAYFWTVLSLVGFIWLLTKESSPKRGALIGFFFGFAYFALGLSWVFKAIYVYGNAPWLFAAAALISLAAALSLFSALVGFIAVRVAMPAAIKASLFIPLLWVAAEFLRGEWICSFGWLTIGYAFIDTLFSSYAPILGVYGVTLAVFAVAGAVVGILLKEKEGAGRVLAGFLCGLVVIGAYALEDVSWSKVGSRLEVRLVQPDLPLALTSSLAKQKAYLERVTQMSVARPMGRPLDLIVWPESVFITLPNYLPAELRAAPALSSMRQECSVLYNAFTQPKAREISNSLLLVNADGKESLIYTKRHLVPFGERVPFGFRWLINLLGIPMADQTAGEEPNGEVTVAGIPVALGICYENLFADELRDWFSTGNPEFILYTANLGWFSESAVDQFTQMSRMRAKESSRPLIQAMNNGGSAYIDAKGTIERQAGPGAQNVDFTLSTAKGEVTPFMRYGFLGIFGVGIVFSLVILLFCALKRRNFTFFSQKRH